MAKTYVPGLRRALKIIKIFMGKWKPKLKNNTSLILFAIAELLADCADIALSIIDISEDSDGQYDPGIPLDSTQYINQVSGAYQKFMNTMTGAS